MTTPWPNKSLRAIGINSIGTGGRRNAAPGGFDFDFSHNAVLHARRRCQRLWPSSGVGPHQETS